MGPGVPLQLEHLERDDQREQKDRIEPREAGQPELALDQRSGPIGVVVGQDVAGDQEEHVHEHVAVVDDPIQRSEVRRREVKEDDIEGEERANAREGGQRWFAGRLGREICGQVAECPVPNACIDGGIGLPGMMPVDSMLQDCNLSNASSRHLTRSPPQIVQIRGALLTRRRGQSGVQLCHAFHHKLTTKNTTPCTYFFTKTPAKHPPPRDKKIARKQPQAVTSEPSFSPLTTLTIFPCSRMLKTIIGMLLSLHRDTAVVSMTPRPSRMMSL